MGKNYLWLIRVHFFSLAKAIAVQTPGQPTNQPTDVTEIS